MLSFLRRPYPAYVYGERVYFSIGLICLTVFSILFWLEPFGLDEVTQARKFRISLSYAGATFLVSVLCVAGGPLLLPRVFDARRWTVGKEIVFFSFMLLLISLANAQVNMWLQDIAFSVSMWSLMVAYTLLIAIAPVTLTILLKQQLLLRRYQREANEVNAWVTGQQVNGVDSKAAPATPVAVPVEPTLYITGDNQGEQLQLTPYCWLAAEASDNYCRIFYVANGRHESVLFRTTLKKLEDQLSALSAMYRCHKSFLVNLEQVTHLSGNAQGYRLHLKGTQLQVPVSRSLHAQLRQKLAQVKQPDAP
ncbi:MAG: LytTR family transcriptional regulator [Chitinophagaceae bacterium]|jgi:hypothetical protein|nr:LytTR family transcriptional regulator [Chitinophagaceae bacterium]